MGRRFVRSDVSMSFNLTSEAATTEIPRILSFLGNRLHTWVTYLKISTYRGSFSRATSKK